MWCITREDFVLDQSAHLFTFSLSANHNAGNEKFTTRRAMTSVRFNFNFFNLKPKDYDVAH